MRTTAVCLVAALLAPTIALAAEYPRHVVVDDMDCTQMVGASGAVETWCAGGEGPPFLVATEEAPSTAPAAVAQPEPTVVQAEVQAESVGGRRQAPRAEGEVPTYISMEAAQALNRGALKLSWSGPMKWGGISSSLLGTMILANGEPDSETFGSLALISGLLFLGLGVALDFSAAQDFSSAAGVYP